jgi:hypothetical protein
LFDFGHLLEALLKVPAVTFVVVSAQARFIASLQ